MMLSFAMLVCVSAHVFWTSCLVDGQGQNTLNNTFFMLLKKWRTGNWGPLGAVGCVEWWDNFALCCSLYIAPGLTLGSTPTCQSPARHHQNTRTSPPISRWAKCCFQGILILLSKLWLFTKKRPFFYSRVLSFICKTSYISTLPSDVFLDELR